MFFFNGDSGEPCEISYGSGSISGFFSQDSVEVGDLVVKDQVGSSSILCNFFFFLCQRLICGCGNVCLTFIFQVFIEATKEGSLTFILARFDGILGLGFQEISVGDAVPVWYVSFCIANATFYNFSIGIVSLYVHDMSEGTIWCNKISLVKRSSPSGSTGIQPLRREEKLFSAVWIQTTIRGSIPMFQLLKRVTGR